MHSAQNGLKGRGLLERPCTSLPFAWGASLAKLLSFESQKKALPGTSLQSLPHRRLPGRHRLWMVFRPEVALHMTLE